MFNWKERVILEILLEKRIEELKERIGFYNRLDERSSTVEFIIKESIEEIDLVKGMMQKLRGDVND